MSILDKLKKSGKKKSKKSNKKTPASKSLPDPILEDYIFENKHTGKWYVVGLLSVPFAKKASALDRATIMWGSPKQKEERQERRAKALKDQEASRAEQPELGV